MYVERPGEKLPPKSLGRVLRERHDDGVERFRLRWAHAKKHGVPLGTGPDAEVPKGEPPVVPYEESPDLDGVVVTYRQPAVEDLDDVDLALAHLERDGVDESSDEPPVEQARRSNRLLRQAVRDYLSLVVDQVEGLEDASGPIVIQRGDDGLSEADLDTLGQADLLAPLKRAHDYLRRLSAAEKKRCGSLPPST